MCLRPLRFRSRHVLFAAVESENQRNSRSRVNPKVEQSIGDVLVMCFSGCSDIPSGDLITDKSDYCHKFSDYLAKRRSKCSQPSVCFGSLADLFPNTSLTSASGTNPAVHQAKIQSSILNVCSHREQPFKWQNQHDGEGRETARSGRSDRLGLKSQKGNELTRTAC